MGLSVCGGSAVFVAFLGKPKATLLGVGSVFFLESPVLVFGLGKPKERQHFLGVAPAWFVSNLLPSRRYWQWAGASNMSLRDIWHGLFKRSTSRLFLYICIPRPSRCAFVSAAC